MFKLLVLLSLPAGILARKATRNTAATDRIALPQILFESNSVVPHSSKKKFTDAFKRVIELNPTEAVFVFPSRDFAVVIRGDSYVPFPHELTGEPTYAYYCSTTNRIYLSLLKLLKLSPQGLLRICLHEVHHAFVSLLNSCDPDENQQPSTATPATPNTQVEFYNIIRMGLVNFIFSRQPDFPIDVLRPYEPSLALDIQRYETNKTVRVFLGGGYQFEYEIYLHKTEVAPTPQGKLLTMFFYTTPNLGNFNPLEVFISDMRARIHVYLARKPGYIPNWHIDIKEFDAVLHELLAVHRDLLKISFPGLQGFHKSRAANLREKLEQRNVPRTCLALAPQDISSTQVIVDSRAHVL